MAPINVLFIFLLVALLVSVGYRKVRKDFTGR
jgi:hypothetical protein